MKVSLLCTTLLLITCSVTAQNLDHDSKTFAMLNSNDNILDEIMATRPTTRASLKNGVYTAWHDNGQKKSEESYKNGKIDGLSVSWYDNGQMKMIETYIAGKIRGTSTSWHENGQKSGEGKFENGIPVGVHTHWYENGKKMCEDRYVNGKSVSTIYWSE